MNLTDVKNKLYDTGDIENIIQPFYRAGFCNFTNVNLHRFMLYKEIYKHFADGSKTISRTKIYEYGKQIGVSKRFVADEIIGCLYAPFLFEREYNNELLEFTYNGHLRFSEFFGEVVHFNNEIPFVIRFDSGQQSFVFKRYLTSNISQERSDQLLSQKWTRNMSKLRFQKKCKSFSDSIETIRQIVDELQQYENYTHHDDYISLIWKYGKKYKNSSNISCNLHSHFMVYSTMLPLYSGIYKALLNKYIKPVDWGGVAIPTSEFYELCSQYELSHSFEEFIKNSVSDGLFRYISDEILTFTSTGYSAITAYEGSSSLMHCFIRLNQEKGFTVHIGENSNAGFQFPHKHQFCKNPEKRRNGFYEIDCNNSESVCDLFGCFTPWLITGL